MSSITTKTWLAGAAYVSLLLSGCASSPFDAQNVQRLLTYEEKSILMKAYTKSPCQDDIYAPLILSIKDRHWRPVKQRDSMCDLVKSIRWVDSNTCETNASRTTIEEEFKLFHGVSLQEVCYQPQSHGTMTANTPGNLPITSKHDLVDTMNAAVQCDAVRYGLIEMTSNESVGTQEYQKMSTLIDMCQRQAPAK